MQRPPDHETTAAVFRALLDTLDPPDREDWMWRYRKAQDVERQRRDYNREYDRSLASVSWGGQGGG